ncbi:MAG: transposase domain-containing protein [Actinomycetota bacterium]|jgi:hypothetical protein|nr:transposase domain-containing protein [Actinomycetota bacterium]
MVYFVLALWLFRGRNCGYARVMSKLVDALDHRLRGEQLLAGPSTRTAGSTPAPFDGGARRTSPRWLGRGPDLADPLHMLLDAVAGPVGPAGPTAGPGEIAGGEGGAGCSANLTAATRSGRC